MLKKRQKQTLNSRRPGSLPDSNFRRNTVVISSKQRALQQRQQSVTQRQADAVAMRQSVLRKRRIITIIVFAVALLLLYRLQISDVALQTNTKLSPLSSSEKTKYSSEITEYIASNVLFKQSWLVHSDDVAKSLQAKYPEVSDVSLKNSTPFSNVATAQIEFRKPILIYKTARDTQYIDADGVLFDTNRYSNVPTSTLPVVEDQGGISLLAGQRVLSRPVIQEVAQIYTLVPKLYGPKATVTGIILPRSSREVQAKISGQPYVIKFSSERPIGDQIAELSALMGYLKANKVIPAQYIDVRVENKAFYK